MSDINCLIERPFADVAEGGAVLPRRRPGLCEPHGLWIASSQHIATTSYRDFASLTFVVFPCTALKGGFRDADDTLAVSETVSPEIYYL